MLTAANCRSELRSIGVSFATLRRLHNLVSLLGHLGCSITRLGSHLLRLRREGILEVLE